MSTIFKHRILDDYSCINPFVGSSSNNISNHILQGNLICSSSNHLASPENCVNSSNSNIMPNISAAQNAMSNMSAGPHGVSDHHLLQMNNALCGGNPHPNLKPSSSSSVQQQQQDSSGKYVRYTAEQVHILERLYNECPKPSSLRRQQLVRENPILQNIEAKQIKVWFQNRRCREKQRKETSRLQSVNAKLTAMNKLLMEENDRLQKQVTQLLYENGYIKQQLQQYVHSGINNSDTSCDSVVTSGLQYLPAPQHQSPNNMQLDATSSGILVIAGDMLKEFVEKATGTATDWMQMPKMKPGPHSAVMLNLSNGVAIRVCGIVNMEPAKIVEVLKDRSAWHRDCRSVTTIFSTCTSNGGCIEVVYIQMYAPTTLSLARDFCVLRYTCLLDDGNYVVCEKSLNAAHAATIAPHNASSFVRSDMYAGGCLVQRNDGTGCVVTIIDHVDPEPLLVPGIVEPYYQSPAYLANNTAISALKYLRDIAQETTLQEASGVGQPVAIRSLSHRLAKGFNQAINGFADEGWIQLPDDGSNDVKTAIRIPGAERERELSNCNSSNNGTLCASASVVLKNASPSFLMRFLREHYSEWMKNGSCNEITQMGYLRFPGFHPLASNSKLLQPQVHAIDDNEFLELIKIEGFHKPPSDGQNIIINNQDPLLLQLCSGLDDNATNGNCGAQMVFAPVDASLSDDIALIPSGFRVIPLENKHKENGLTQSKRTLDLASTLDVGNVCNSDASACVDDSQLSVLTIALQISFQLQTQDNMKIMTRKYVRNVIDAVQRSCIAMVPARTLQHMENTMHTLPSHDDDGSLPQWICKSYKNNLGVDLVQVKTENYDAYNKALMNLADAVICCTCEMRPVFTYANKRGLDMLEMCSYPDMTRVPLQCLSWERILRDNDSRKDFSRVIEEVMKQGYAYLPEDWKWATYRGGRASYARGLAWKVGEGGGSTGSSSRSSIGSNGGERVAFLFVDWSIGE